MNKIAVALIKCFVINLFFAVSISAPIEIQTLFDNRAYRESELFFNDLEKNVCTDSEAVTNQVNRSRTKKPWTFLVYIAADNDLHPFAANNMKQMAAIGSNANINILIHLDVKMNNKKVTRRYYVEQGNFKPAQTLPVAYMDSGDPKTLVSFCCWGMQQCPADDYALILWNHGTGYIDPKYNKIINPAELFSFNPSTNKLELDRSIAFLDLLFSTDHSTRGICWDNTTGNYLTNQKLEDALHEICATCLNGKKLSIIGFDACLMSMLEVATLVKKYADIMVGSQEVELGTGWNYTQVLQPFSSRTIDKYTLAQHIVTAYENAYRTITNDYTQSAINLAHVPALEQNLHQVASLLIECLSRERNRTAINAIKACRDKKACTHFDEPTYIDLHHFYCNLQEKVQQLDLTSSRTLAQQLNAALNEGKQLIATTAFANVAGKNLSRAKGLSIYFPEKFIHSSYSGAPFAKSNAWFTFLNRYLS